MPDAPIDPLKELDKIEKATRSLMGKRPQALSNSRSFCYAHVNITSNFATIQVYESIRDRLGQLPD